MAIVEAFASGQRTYSVFIAHDLDQDNTRLLRDGRISAVLSGLDWEGPHWAR